MQCKWVMAMLCLMGSLPLRAQNLELSVPLGDGWEEKRPGFFEGPTFDRYRLNIQIQRLSDARYIDSIEAKKIKADLLKKFTQSIYPFSNYQVEEGEYLEMPYGQRVLLYFASFRQQGVDMNHLHLVAASESQTYLLTFSGPKGFIDSPQYNEVWDKLNNLEISNQNTSRSADLTRWGLVLFVVFSLALLMAYWRKKKVKEEYELLTRKIASGEDIGLDPKLAQLDDQESMYSQIVIEEEDRHYDTGLGDEMDVDAADLYADEEIKKKLLGEAENSRLDETIKKAN